MLENPDVELDITRDDDGRITHLSYKVNKEGDKRQNSYEFLSMVHEMFKAEGPEDHSTSVDVRIGLT